MVDDVVAVPLHELASPRGLMLKFIARDLDWQKVFCDRPLIVYSAQIVEKLRSSDSPNIRALPSNQ